MKRLQYSLLAAVGILVLAFVITVAGPQRLMAALGYTPVRDVDQPARQPFMVRLGPTAPPGFVSGSASFIVPTGKQLVIETISVTASVPQGQGQRVSPQVGAFTGASLNPGVYAVPVEFSLTSGGREVYVGTIPVRVYADPGSVVSVGFNRSPSTGTAGGDFTISGHLVNLP